MSTSELSGEWITDPRKYPEASLLTSCLLLGKKQHRLREMPGRRLPQWRVSGSFPQLNGDQSTDSLPLNYVLLRHNQTPMAHRIPVIATGILAVPRHLMTILAEHGVSPVMPVVLSPAIIDVAVGASAHIGKDGRVPPTLAALPGTRSEVFLLWPDRSQLAALDTALPDHHRILLPGSDFPVEMPSGEQLSRSYGYVGVHGHLVDDQGHPMLPGSVTTSNGPADVQRELLQALLDRDSSLRDLLGSDPESFVERAAGGNDEARENARALFRNLGWVGRSERFGVPGLRPDEPSRPRPLCYEDEPPIHPVPEGAMRVLPSSDDFDRRGQPTVRVTPELADRWGRRLVLVSRATESPSIEALARPLAHPGLGTGQAVEVDQLIRNSIGVEIGEDVRLTPVTARRNRLFDFVLGKPNYVVCRVQAADLTTVEQEVCLLDELTLGILGIQAGDEIIVEGTASPEGVVQQVRAKAFKTSEVVQHRRESLHGGDLSCRFPSSRDALAVHPDLPWIFLDSATRSAVGLGDRKLATVRLRPSRWYQMRKEVRELLLLMGLAFIGLVSILDRMEAQLLSLAALVLFVAAVVVTRMRGRLKHDLRISLGQRFANHRSRRRTLPPAATPPAATETTG
jgi:hypothetical protein